MSNTPTKHPVIVCTAHRGVFFGHTTDPKSDPINLTGARMCIRWENVGGVMGLAENGPTNAVKSGEYGCRIGATADITLKNVTAIFKVKPKAEQAWHAAPVYGLIR